MPSKKKSKPSYDVPEELQRAPQAGWVYRSDASRPSKAKAASTHKSPAKTAPIAALASAPAVRSQVSIPAAAVETPHASRESHSQSSSSKLDDGIIDLAARTISSSFNALGNAVLLTTRIITAP